MIDTDKYERLNEVIDSAIDSHDEIGIHALHAIAWLSKHYVKELLAEVKRLSEENKVLAKYRDIVTKYDDALLADGDRDPRWSELYD